MKTLSFVILTCALSLLPGKILALSISYEGFACQNAVNTDDPSPSSVRVESHFEIIEIIEGRLIRLSLSGGLPRFVDNNNAICIDSDTAIGFEGVPGAAGSQGLPVKLDKIDATAYFNGTELVIIVNSIFTDFSASRGTFNSFSTSRLQPVSNTLIFSYEPDTTSFELTKIIHNKGFIRTSGSTATFPFVETIIPSFDAVELIGMPQILTPPSKIIYRLSD